MKPLGLLGLALAMLLVTAAVPVAPAAGPGPVVLPMLSASRLAVNSVLDLRPGGAAPTFAPAARPPREVLTVPEPPRDLALSPAPPTALAPPAPVPTRTLDDVLETQVVPFHPLLRFRQVTPEPVAADAVPAPDPTARLVLPEGECVAAVGSSVPEPSLLVCNSWVRSDEAPSLASLIRATQRSRTLELGLLAWSEPTLPDEFDPDALKAGIGVREDEEVEVRLGLYPKFPDDAYQQGDHMLDTEDFSRTRAFLRAAWDW